MEHGWNTRRCASEHNWVFGLASYLLIQSIAMAVAGGAGLWLFYVQHQFKGVCWERNDEWDYTAAALRGNSYYKLPELLQWLSGNIGFHHIHHLSPRIPNYNAQRCHESDSRFAEVTSISLRSSLQSLRFRFWDEQTKELVGYAHLRKLEADRRASSSGMPLGADISWHCAPAKGDRIPSSPLRSIRRSAAPGRHDRAP